jgi:pSer/pThr/pTyr-binding forkhead associated (FHA) protein
MGVRLLVAREASTGPEGTDETSWEFAQPRIVLGRASASDVVLPHPSVSGRHATIEADGVRYFVVDHGSLNGTWVNGARIVPERRKPLRDGDVVSLGLFRLRFVANVPVNDVPSRERTAELARRLLRAARGTSEPGAGRRLTLANGPEVGRVIELPPAPARLVVGRGEGCDVVLADGDASREHCELVIDADGVLLRDLGSKNGVMVGERRVAERRLLDRDELRVGATQLVFEDFAEPSLKAIEALPDEPAPPPASVAPPPAATPVTPEPAAAPSPSDALRPEGASEPPARRPSRAPAPRSGIAPAEWAVYGLALIVFVLSAVGLAWLLRGP